MIAAGTSRANLTHERIRRFTCPPDKPQAFLWDTKAPHLALRVTRTGARAFIWQGKIRGTGQTVRITLGTPDVWTLDDARETANQYQQLADKGIDPREVRKEEERRREEAKAAKEAGEKYTLKTLCAAYVRHLEVKGKIRAAGAAASAFRCHVDGTDTASRPARDVTPQEIAALIRAPQEAGKERTAGVLRSYLMAAYAVALRAPFDARLPAELVPYGITVNPLNAIPAIPTNARHRTLAPHELGMYAAALGSMAPIRNADDMSDAALWAALLAGSQRMRQLLRAKVTDWNPATETLQLFDGKGKRREARPHLIPLAKDGAAFIAHLVERAEAMGHDYIFAVTGKPISADTAGHRLTAIRERLALNPFDLRDIRRTVETTLAALKVSKDIRGQLQSHGLGGVQNVHYDKHDYAKEKRAALVKWEKYLMPLRAKFLRGHA